MKSVLAIQSTVPMNVTESLEKLALDYLPTAEFAPYLRDKGTQLQSTHMIRSRIGEVTRIRLDSAGKARLDQGIIHRPKGIGDEEVILQNHELLAAIALAFQSVYQDMERIFDKDMKNADHSCHIGLVIYKAGQNAGAGPWHADGLEGLYDTPVTSLVYFLHEGCDALFSMLLGTGQSAAEYTKEFASIQTKAGMSITFANDRIKHRVHDVKSTPVPLFESVMSFIGGTTAKPPLRGLLSFFYRGPASLPPHLVDSSSFEHRNKGYEVKAEEEVSQDNRQMVVYSQHRPTK